MESISAQSLPLHRPVILDKNKTLREAALAMERNQVGSVLVSDGHGILKGVFTDRDLALALGLEKVKSSDHLSEATQAPLIYVSENATLPEVVGVMKQYGIRRVPVVRIQSNGRQRCLGVISLDDLVRNNHITIKEEAEILKSQLKAPKSILSQTHVKNIFHAQDQKEESLRLFLKKIEKETGLDPILAKSLTGHVLSIVFRCISAQASKSILSQLPYELQVQLISEIGPVDTSITVKSFLNQIKKRYHLDDEGAHELLFNFWRGLESSLSKGEIVKLKKQLPKEMLALFTEAKKRQTAN